MTVRNKPICPSLSLKCFYFLNQNQNPKTREFRIPNSNDQQPCSTLKPCNSTVVIRPTIQGTQRPPCVMTTGVWNGTVDPSFGYSGMQESLLTQSHRTPRLITLTTRRRVFFSQLCNLLNLRGHSQSLVRSLVINCLPSFFSSVYKKNNHVVRWLIVQNREPFGTKQSLLGIPDRVITNWITLSKSRW